MRKTILILAIAIVGIGMPSAFACSPEDTINWFSVRVGPNLQLNHEIEPSITSFTTLHIPFMGGEVWSDDLRDQIIADRFNELGYFVGVEPNTRPVSPNDIGSVDVNGYYSTQCINGVMQVVGGMLLQPDAATLVLAYGIANSIWIVPSVAGIGIAVYLTRNRLQKH